MCCTASVSKQRLGLLVLLSWAETLLQCVTSYRLGHNPGVVVC